MTNNTQTEAKIGSPISRECSDRIRAIRYIGIVGVVLIHAIQSPYFFLHGGYFTSCHEYDDFLNGALCGFMHSLVIYGLFYGAVPMFFIFSGYLQSSKQCGYKSTVLRRVRSLLIPMAVWTLLNVLVLFALKFVAGIKFWPELQSSCDWRLWGKAIFGDYSNGWIRGTHCPFFMFQFWFIRDLFILTLISPFIGFLMRERKRGLLALLVFGTILAMGYRSFIVGGDALFYYSLGVFFASWKMDFMKLLDRFWNWGFAVLLAICSVTWMFAKYEGNPDPDTPMWVQLSSTLILMKLSAVVASSEKLFKVARFLDGQAFFLYCVHAPMATSMCTWLVYYALHDTTSPVWAVPVILFMGILNAGFCTGAGILLNRFSPRVFEFLTGGRTMKLKR